jgi:O-antigen ligase
MDNKIETKILGIAAFVMMFVAAYSILKGDILSYAKALAFLSPFLFIVVIRTRRNWHIMLMGFLVASRVRIPVYGLQQITLTMILLLCALAVHMADTALDHSRRQRGSGNWIDRSVFAMACILTVRIIYDRPGFVGLGMAQGGFFEAFTIVSAAWFYFPAKKMFAEASFTRKGLCVAGAITALVGIYDLSKGDGLNVWRPFGASSFWMLCAIVLSLLSTSNRVLTRTVWTHLVSLLFIAAGVLSGYRARIAYFFAEALLISYYGKRLLKTAVFLGVVCAAGVVLILSVSDTVPDVMRRFVSLFMETEKGSDVLTGAYGWTDSFREELARLAFIEIRKNPLAGSGFGLNVSEAIGILTANANRDLSLLALAGSYHNSILMLAVKAGLPVAIIFIVISVVIAYRFIGAVKKTTDQDIRVWGMAISAFWFANMIQMQVNGGPVEYSAGLVLAGLMMGMMKNPAMRPLRGSTLSGGKEKPESAGNNLATCGDRVVMSRAKTVSVLDGTKKGEICLKIKHY